GQHRLGELRATIYLPGPTLRAGQAQLRREGHEQPQQHQAPERVDEPRAHPPAQQPPQYGDEDDEQGRADDDARHLPPPPSAEARMPRSSSTSSSESERARSMELTMSPRLPP